MTSQELIFASIDLGLKTIALLIGGLWALVRISEYRELKNWLQFDIDADIYQLSQPETAQMITWNKDRCAAVQDPDPKSYTHAVEIRLTLTNRGKTRARIFNIQAGISTMHEPGCAQADPDDFHLKLKRIFTSGNLVPRFTVTGKPEEDTSFFYIEPGVEQNISYLCLIPEPRELVQVMAKFSLEQKRLFPEFNRTNSGLYPHRVAKTFPFANDRTPATQHRSNG